MAIEVRAYNTRFLIIIFLVIAGGLAVVGNAAVKYFEGKSIELRQIQHEQKNLHLTLVKNNLLLNGFQVIYEWPEELNNPDRTLIFVGHIYPRNNYSSPSKKSLADRDQPLNYLLNIALNNTPQRIIFGGDNVHTPMQDALEHLNSIKQSFPQNTVRFLIGNHEKYWESLLKIRTQFESVYEKRFSYEDVNGIRLIYLHTVIKDGSYGIDKEQVEFLKKVLNRDDYDYALVFQHHALWAGDTIHANEKYPDGEKAKDQWQNLIIPMIKKGNVKAVFSGDGGRWSPGRMMRIQDIPHYVTGWAGIKTKPSAWLTIELGEKSPRIIWNKYFHGNHYKKLK